MNRQLNIEVRDTVFDPNLPDESPCKAHFHIEGGRHLYKVWLYLSGDDLVYVQSATYTLHQTFPDPVRKVTRSLSNPNCQLVIWTWGLFEVKVVVEDKSNQLHEFKHNLSYDRELRQPNITYVEGD